MVANSALPSLTAGAFIASTRLQRGLSPEQLASEVGVKLQTVQRWERDDNRPQRRARPRLAAALHLSVNELAAGLRTGSPHKRSAGADATLHKLPGAVSAGGDTRAQTEQHEPGITSRTTQAFDAALSIIAAKGGLLSDDEASIVKMLLEEHRGHR